MSPFGPGAQRRRALPLPARGAQVQLKRRGDDEKYVAKVLAIGTECDLALLTGGRAGGMVGTGWGGGQVRRCPGRVANLCGFLPYLSGGADLKSMA